MSKYSKEAIKAAARQCERSARTDPRRYGALVHEMGHRTGLPAQTILCEIRRLANGQQ